MQYWNNLITEKSWNILQELKIRKDFNFILIGGWAVYLFAKTHKSKDIDIIVVSSRLDRMEKNIGFLLPIFKKMNYKICMVGNNNVKVIYKHTYAS